MSSDAASTPVGCQSSRWFHTLFFPFGEEVVEEEEEEEEEVEEVEEEEVDVVVEGDRVDGPPNQNTGALS